jgi:hypothetical protein
MMPQTIYLSLGSNVGDPGGEFAVQLDQCWDLLRQRRARREFGQDPKGAQVRSPEVVEHYEG